MVWEESAIRVYPRPFAVHEVMVKKPGLAPKRLIKSTRRYRQNGSGNLGTVAIALRLNKSTSLQYALARKVI